MKFLQFDIVLGQVMSEKAPSILALEASTEIKTIDYYYLMIQNSHGSILVRSFDIGLC